MDETSCFECGKRLHPAAPGVTLVGWRSGREALYAHAECRAQMAERAAYSTKCRGCPRTFDRRNGEAGRPAEYHSEQCRRAHAARVMRLWSDAAKGRLPDDLDTIARVRADLLSLIDDVRHRRYDGVAPGHAARVLATQLALPMARFEASGCNSLMRWCSF